jgi:hypothetical protein
MVSNNFLRRALGKILSRSDQQQPALRQRRLFLENLEDRRLLAAEICSIPFFSSVAPTDDDHDHFDDHHDHDAMPVFVDGILTPGDVETQFPYGKDNTFKLESNPTSTKTIYLDYDGHHSINNNWNQNVVYPAFNTEGSPDNFSDDELSEIQKQFIEVVEDFLPFDVNVTTTDPGIAALTKSDVNDDTWGVRSLNTQCISGQGHPCNIGGTAGWIGGFSTDVDDHVLVYNKGVWVGSQTNSHEIGHRLGLLHDGLPGQTYHPGVGTNFTDTSWGPIMGGPFFKNLAQWSKGDYPGATNTIQDDLAIITNSTNGIEYRSDDHGNTRSTATALVITNDTEVNVNEVDNLGIVERNNDVDYFSFTTGVGNVTLQINPVMVRGSLDVAATLYNSHGQFVAFSNQPNGISASFNQNLAAGEYFIKVDGVGNSNSSNSDYGSLGYYEITGTIVKGTNEPPTVTAIADVVVNEDAAAQNVDLSGITAGTGDSQQPIRVTASSSNTGLMADPTVNYTSPNATGTLTFTPNADQFGTSTITVTIEDGGIDNNLATTGNNATITTTFVVTVNAVNDDPPTIAAIDDVTVDEDSGDTIVNFAGITAGPGEVQPLRVTAVSSNATLIGDPTVTYNSPNTTGTLTVAPLADQSGTTTITVTVEDGGPDANLNTPSDNVFQTETFDIVVNALTDDAPTLDAIANTTGNEDAAVSVDLTGITAGADETQTLIVTATSADTNLIPHPSVAYTNGTTVGTINYTPVANQSGTTTVTVLVEDGGLDDNLATTGDNLTISRTFTVTVDALDDDPPTIASIANVTTDEDAPAQTINFNGITAGFNETQTLVVTSTSSNPSLIANPSVTYTSDDQTGSLSFTPLSDQFGAATITVTVEDGGLDGDLATAADNLTTTTTFDVVVNPVNDLPMGDTPANITVAEDTPTTVNITGITAGPNETQSLRLSATSDTPGLIANPTGNYTNGNTTGTINFTPQADQYGTATITVIVEDGGADNNLSTPADNLTSSSTFDVTVTPVNDAPGQNVVVNVTVAEDSPTQSVAINGISAGPNETQPLHITAVSSDPSLFADPSVTYTSADTSGSLSFVPNANQYGTATVTITIEDGGQDNDLSTAADNLTSSSTFDITVSPENDAPTQTTHADITTSEDAIPQSVNITGITAGPNETQILHVTATSSDSTLIANPMVNYTSGDTISTLHFTPIANQYGTTTVTVTVEDGGLDNNLTTRADNLTSSTTFDIVVDPVNDAPSKAANANVTINEDTPSTVAITGINAGPNETETLRITATSSDTTLVPDPSVNYTNGNTNGDVVFTPLTDQYGTATVTVTIEDGGLDNDLSTPADNLTNSSTFAVIVNPVNDLPAGDTIENVTVDEDVTLQTINITGLTAGPNETQPLRVTATSSNAGLLLNPTVNYTSGSQTGGLQFTPLTDQYGSSTITVTIEDGGLDNNLATANDNLTSTSTFDITVNPINDAPVANSIVDITVDEDDPIQTISLTGIGSGPNESQPVRVTATSSDSTILADPIISLSNGSAVGALNFIPIAMQDGDVTITVAIEDGGLDNDLSTAADNLTVTRDFDITILPTLGDYRTPTHKAVVLEQVTRLESGVKSFTFTTDTTGYYQVVTATQFATNVQMTMPVIMDALGNTVSAEATGIAAERESMTYNTLLLQSGTYQVEVGSFNGANERMKLSVSMPAVTTSADLNDRAVDLTTGAVLQNELGVNGLSSGLFQQIYDVDLSTPIFHQEFDANLDESLTSFDLKTVRFNAETSSPSVTLSMNSVASQMAAFAPAVAAVGEMGVADTFGMSIYQNPLSMNDVNGDSQVTPNDALIIINHLNSGATQRLDALQLVDSLNVSGFIDTNGDYNSSPIDVLQVINQLNAMTTDVVVDQGAEGEGFVAAVTQVPMLLPDANTTVDLHFESLDALNSVNVDFGFNLNAQRASVTAQSATWSTKVDELFANYDLENLADQEDLVDFSDSISAH